MRVVNAMGREMEASHMPLHGHHVAFHGRGRGTAHSWFKLKGQGIADMNAQSTDAVMADGISRRVGDDGELISGWEQGIMVMQHLASLSVVETAPSQAVEYITVLVLVCNGLAHLAVGREAQITMVRPRQRLLSRRGSSRGGGSNRPVRNVMRHCCHCNLVSSIGAAPLLSGHHLDAETSSSASLPAFGSTIFNFTSSTENPRISAHVSILFIESPPEVDDPMDAQEQGTQDHQKDAEQVPTAEMEQDDKSRAIIEDTSKQSQNAPTATAGEVEATSPTHVEKDYYGWYPIVEEKMDEPSK